MKLKNRTNKDEVFIEETINASLERVFAAWTDPKKLMNWYAPQGCTIYFKKIKIATGGHFHSCISNLQYGDCWCIGEYKEVIPNSKIVFTMINADENGNPINPIEIINMDSKNIYISYQHYSNNIRWERQGESEWIYNLYRSGRGV